MKLENSVALVTGANRGIGRTLVTALLARGARRVYAAARALPSVKELQDHDRERIVPLALDVTDVAQVQAAAERAHDLTLLINNAGVANFGHSLRNSVEDTRRDMETNYFGTLSMIRAFAPVLEQNGGGVIANLLSVVSLANMPAAAGYSASKAAAFSLTQAVRAELAPRGIHVCGVFPGPVDTDMAKDLALPKTGVDEVVAAILDGIEQRSEDILPDPMSKQVYQAWISDPKGLERQFGQMI